MRQAIAFLLCMGLTVAGGTLGQRIKTSGAVHGILGHAQLFALLVGSFAASVSLSQRLGLLEAPKKNPPRPERRRGEREI